MLNPNDLEIRLRWANWHQWRPGQRVEQSAMGGHSFWLLSRGSVRLTSGENSLVISEGDALLWPPREKRLVEAVSEAEWLSVGLEVLVYGYLDVLDRLAPPRAWTVPEGDRAELETWLRRLIQHRRPVDSAEAVLADGVARALVATVWRSLSQRDLGTELESAVPPWLPLVVRCQRNQPDVSVQGLAAAAHLSSVHLRREYARVLGTTPHAWLASRRLETSRHLLQSTQLPVKAVAARAGYDSASHFARIFKATFGKGPDQYRREAAATEALTSIA